MEIIPILHKIFQKIETEETFPNSFYEIIIILIPKPDKDKEGKQAKENKCMETYSTLFVVKELKIKNNEIPFQAHQNG